MAIKNFNITPTTEWDMKKIIKVMEEYYGAEIKHIEITDIGKGAFRLQCKIFMDMCRTGMYEEGSPVYLMKRVEAELATIERRSRHYTGIEPEEED